MRYTRVIPVLLIHKGGVYKTSRFKNPVYIGDPINAIRIFNDLEVDEICILDIDASKSNIIHNNKAANLKSKLTKHVNSLTKTKAKAKAKS